MSVTPPPRKLLVARTLLAIGLVILFLLISAYFAVQTAAFRGWIQGEVSRRTGYDVSFGALALDPRLRIVAVEVALVKSGEPVFHGEKVVISFTPIDFLFQTIHRIQLVRPVFTLDPSELLSSPSAPAPKLSIHKLNIEDGTVVLKTADGKRLDFRSITLNAENLNLAQEIGVDVRAEVPWLAGKAELSIRGGPKEKKAEIRVRPRQGGKTARSAAPDAEPSLNMHITLREKQAGAWELTALGDLREFDIGNEPISGRFEGRVDLNSDLTDAAFSARARAPRFPSKAAPVPLAVPEGGATAMMEGSYSVRNKVLALKRLHVDSSLGVADGTGTINLGPRTEIVTGRVNLRGFPLGALKPILPPPLDLWTYQGTAAAELTLRGAWSSVAVKGSVRGAGIQIKSEHFSAAKLSFDAPVEWGDGSFDARPVRIQGAALAINRKDRLQATAETIRLDGELRAKANEPLKVTARLRLGGGRFATPDGAKVGENLAAVGRADLAHSRAPGFSSVKGELTVQKGEVLWGKFFGDLGSQNPAVEFDGDYFAAGDEVRLRRLGLTLAAVGKVALSGSVERVSQTPTLHLEARSDEVRPGGIFNFFIRDTFNRSYPVLDRLGVGGKIAFSLRANGPLDRLTAEGTTRLTAGEIRARSGDWRIGPIELALPFRIRLPGGEPESPGGEPAKGTLVVRSVRFGAESVPAIETALSLWNNALRFRQPIVMPIYGGTVEIGSLSWRDVIRKPKQVSFSLNVKSVQLGKLTDALGWHRFAGTLAASIPQVEWSGNALSSRGEARLDVFGGRVRLAGMQIINPFSPLPSIKADVRLDGIHLEQASETFEFGRISGILEGAVDDLVITDGQPSQLKADIHTVESPGVSQWISVEALNRITVLSSGSDAGVIYGGIAGFFDSFRYSRLGFKAALKNDKLTLRGVERKDGKEFLVVGSFFPPTVNVISHTQEIGFSELMRRLERIQKSAKPAK